MSKHNFSDHLHFIENKGFKTLFACFSLTLILFGIQSLYINITNSLLLYTIGLVQLNYMAFLSTALISEAITNQPKKHKLRMAITFFSNGIMLILTIYVFIEFFMRLNMPITITTNPIISITAVSLMAHLFINTLLNNTLSIAYKHDFKKKTSSGIMWLLKGTLMIAIIMYLTEYNMLDTVLGFFLALILFAHSLFSMLDAYWNITDLASSVLCQKNEIELDLQ